MVASPFRFISPPGRVPYTGIVFIGHQGWPRADRASCLVLDNRGTDLCTVLCDPAGVHVATVEQLMAAIFRLGIEPIS